MHELNILGFSEKEQVVYLALLEVGVMTVAELSKNTNLKRTSLYSYLEELKQKGLVFEIFDHNRRYFQAVEPKSLFQFTQNKIKELEKVEKSLPKVIEKLTLISAKKKSIKTGEKIYRGVTGIRELLHEVAASEDDVHFLGSSKGFHQYFDPKLLEKIYIKQRRKNLRTDHLITDWDSIEINRFFEESGLFTKIRFLPPHLNANGGFVVFGTKVILIQYSPKPFATVVEDSSLSELFKLAFASLWNDLDGKNLPSPIH